MGDRGGSPSQLEVLQTLAGLYELVGQHSSHKTGEQINWAHRFLNWFIFDYPRDVAFRGGPEPDRDFVSCPLCSVYDADSGGRERSSSSETVDHEEETCEERYYAKTPGKEVEPIDHSENPGREEEDGDDRYYAETPGKEVESNEENENSGRDEEDRDDKYYAETLGKEVELMEENEEPGRDEEDQEEENREEEDSDDRYYTETPGNEVEPIEQSGKPLQEADIELYDLWAKCIRAHVEPWKPVKASGAQANLVIEESLMFRQAEWDAKAVIWDHHDRDALGPARPPATPLGEAAKIYENHRNRLEVSPLDTVVVDRGTEEELRIMFGKIESIIENLNGRNRDRMKEKLGNLTEQKSKITAAYALYDTQLRYTKLQTRVLLRGIDKAVECMVKLSGSVTKSLNKLEYALKENVSRKRKFYDTETEMQTEGRTTSDYIWTDGRYLHAETPGKDDENEKENEEMNEDEEMNQDEEMDEEEMDENESDPQPSTDREP
ncbi:hypothetical protein GLAREA_04790 [Glarea lozoyensis ATCC 20868]|uniref:Uncharacterized protein n=1 Tax=Glarea lozoyensis (strain ATCC 20868 / MF5171) TaxID=1116229 RepID=S3CSE9_GLAL2|nr:uncharacterized protein GLAREA_04790 [Glarea lozoyensis ATCC 20868]EPE27999.1 hypothetical protein GLAREA_04790 [Glarea lozoyensis ATCC 20868]